MSIIRHAALVAVVLTSSAAGAQQITDGSVKIGVMNDMSGLYSDISGRGALVAARRSMLGAGGRLGGNA